jgi:acyl-CoA synthetase (NDP forming)
MGELVSPATSELSNVARGLYRYREDRPLQRGHRYTTAQMRPLVAPESVAIVGVSAAPEAPGSWIFRNLVDRGFTGDIHLVNPKYDTLFGLPCYPSIDEITENIDCALVAVAPDDSLRTIEQCAQNRVGSAIIFSSGFAETGSAEDVKRQARIGEIADRTRIPVSGPNTLGLINFVDQKYLTIYADAAVLPTAPGHLAVISQSGGLGFDLAHCRARGIGLSYVFTAGNSVDVDIVDYLNYAVEDESTQAIVLVVEGVQDARSLVDACERAITAGKPVVVHKLGLSDAGARAAATHTGTLVGSSEVYAAAFREVGAIEVGYEDLLDTAQMFVKDWRPKGKGVGVLSTSGGAAVLASDSSALYNVCLPAPSAATSERLKAEIPGFGVVGNPTDLTGVSVRRTEMFANAMHAFANDPEFAAVVVPVFVTFGSATEDRPAMVAAAAARLSKPVCAVWMSAWKDGPGIEALHTEKNVAYFESIASCFQAVSRWLNWHDVAAKYRRSTCEPPSWRSVNIQRALDFAKSFDRMALAGGPLSEPSSMRILETIGVIFPDSQIATSAIEADRISKTLGSAVVMKLASRDIPHKTAVGGVSVGVAAGEAAQEYERLIRVGKSVLGTTVDRILIQEMVAHRSEFFIGARRDPQFGPVVVCGRGGTDVEAVNDVTVALAPLDERRARSLVAGVLPHPPYKHHDSLSKHEYQAAADSLADVVLRVASLIANEARISQIDINPIVVRESGVPCALDALVVLSAPE